MTDPARIAAELLIAARPAFVKAVTDGEVDHCVLFTRLAVDIARQRGILARPLVVTVELRGEVDQDSVFLLGAEGLLPRDAPPDAWDGHLVAIFDRRLMVDLSIDAATNAEMGIAPLPLVIDVSPEFLAGGVVETDIPGGRATYTAHPKRRDFRTLVAWQPTPTEDAARLADHILWHPDRVI